MKDWIAFPVAKEQITAKQANTIASHLHFFPKPLSMVYIGPPAVIPLLSKSLYSTASVHSAYLRADPKNAVIHIQKRAPGPP